MINRLFTLQVAYISLIILFSQDFIFIYYWQLGYIGLDNRKNILERQSLDFKKVILIKSCKTYTKAK